MVAYGAMNKARSAAHSPALVTAYEMALKSPNTNGNSYLYVGGQKSIRNATL